MTLRHAFLPIFITMYYRSTFKFEKYWIFAYISTNNFFQLQILSVDLFSITTYYLADCGCLHISIFITSLRGKHCCDETDATLKTYH